MSHHSMRYRLFSLVAVASFGGLLLGGCVAAGGSEPGSEEVGEAQEAFGEAACTTVAADPKSAPNGAGVSVWSTSPNGTYNPAGCPNQWVAEFSRPNGFPYITHITWADTMSSTVCNAAHLVLTAWSRNDPDGGTGPWTQVGTTTILNGSWSNGQCSFPGATPFINGGSEKVRLAGSAYTQYMSGTKTYKKVSVGLQASF